MARFSSDVASAKTLWVQRPGRRPAKVRMVATGDRVVCFGDDGLSDVHDGERVDAAVHQLHFGPPLDTFSATVREVPGDEVEREALLELLAHVPLGRTLEEVEAAVEEQRRTRRILELVP